MFFRQVLDERLAQYSYLIGCPATGEAIVVDPQRDIDRYLFLAHREGLRVVAAAETHVHADFLSGARELADQVSAAIYLSEEGGERWRYDWVRDPRYDFRPLRHHSQFKIGNVVFKVLHTPGHTPEHLSYLVSILEGGERRDMGLLSGDFVFSGDLGRPDLLESAVGVTGAMKASASQLFASLEQFLALPDHLHVWPGHGAGSACGKALNAVPGSTVGLERRFNPAIQEARKGEESFVSWILHGQPEPPMYFSCMKRDNKLGPAGLRKLPRPSRLKPETAAQVARSAQGCAIDTRADRSAFMAQHLPGAIYAPLSKSFCTAVGSVVGMTPEGIILIVEERFLADAVRALVRIGFDDIRGFVEPEELAAFFEAGGESASIPEIDFDEAVAMSADGDATIVDVRYGSEYDALHLPGAINASYTRLSDYEKVIPQGPLIVHCLTGARAAVACSWFASRGRDVFYVNDVFTTRR